MGAYARFHDENEAGREDFPGLSPYTAAELASEIKGLSAWSWGAAAEIQETINAANAWGVRLHEWAAWNRVLSSHVSDDEKWEISSHFIEPIAFFCMLQPSSLADRLVVASETAMHQATQRVFRGSPDRLEQDKLKVGAVLRRKERRKQLDRLGQPWLAYPPFRQALDAMNGSSYVALSQNFRDLAAHSFPPRFFVGHIARAVRSIVPLQELKEQPDGTYLQVDHPTKKAVQYAMCEMPPLSLQDAHAANFLEYRHAQHALRCFNALVEELCERMSSMGQNTIAP